VALEASWQAPENGQDRHEPRHDLGKINTEFIYHHLLINKEVPNQEHWF